MIEDVLDELRDQLAWRGPTGKRMGHVVLPREMAEVLLKEMEHWTGARMVIGSLEE